MQDWSMYCTLLDDDDDDDDDDGGGGDDEPQIHPVPTHST